MKTLVRKGMGSIAAVLLLLTLVWSSTALAQTEPQLNLVHPSLPTATLGSGAPNVIGVNATAPGSSITSAEYQAILGDPAGTLVAMEVFAQGDILPVPAPKIGGGVQNDTTPAPAGLPAGSVVRVVVNGTVAAVDAQKGEWQIDIPGPDHAFVYERLDGATSIGGIPAVGTQVRVAARRTLDPGPIVADTITQLAAGALSDVNRSFLFNGTVETVVPAVQSAGLRIGGEVWTIGGIPFRMDDPQHPARISQGIGLGAGLDPVVTVQFLGAAPIAPAAPNVALQIRGQDLGGANPVPAPLHPSPRVNTQAVPLQIPAGSWMGFEIEGPVTAINANGEWGIGTPPVWVYEFAITDDQGNVIASTLFTGAERPIVGDDVKVRAVRTLAPGPLVASQIDRRRVSLLPQAPAVVVSTFLFNGTVGAIANDIWTVGGVSFAVNDPTAPAVIDNGLAVGSLVTVEFDFIGPPPPDAALWAPLSLDSATSLWSAVVTPPAMGADLSGQLFLRATNALGQVTTTMVPASLLAVPAAAPTAPANLVAMTSSTTQVDLTWADSSLDEVSFRVERATDTGFTQNLQQFVVAANSTSLSDKTITGTATTYHYRVLAVNGAGASPSNETQVVAGTPPPPPPPPADSGPTQQTQQQSPPVVPDAPFVFADFSASVTSGASPLTVTFTDLSTGGPTSWSWDFGDGVSTTEQNPTHVYASEGTFTVTLRTSNEGRSDIETRVISVGQVPPSGSTEAEAEKAAAEAEAKAAAEAQAKAAAEAEAKAAAEAQAKAAAEAEAKAAAEAQAKAAAEAEAKAAAEAEAKAAAEAEAKAAAEAEAKAAAEAQAKAAAEAEAKAAAEAQAKAAAEAEAKAAAEAEARAAAEAAAKAAAEAQAKAEAEARKKAEAEAKAKAIMVPPPQMPGAVTRVAEPARETMLVLPDRTTIRIASMALPQTAQVQARAVSPQELPKAPQGKMVKALDISLFSTQGTPMGPTSLAAPMTIEVPLSDEEMRLIGDNPSSVHVAYFDEATAQWERLESSLDLGRKVVQGKVTHMSLFAVVISEPATSGG
ncbi:MAG: PKD domain-containing protein, partial [Chloroflexi bacterium]|nr:PKD domain-containing protein [Chloroflexota bacterium]